MYAVQAFVNGILLCDTAVLLTYHGSNFTITSYKHIQIIVIFFTIMYYWYLSIKYMNKLELQYIWNQLHPLVVVQKKYVNKTHLKTQIMGNY